ncbi:phage holin family protein [Vibrio porteresiae]|uniref:Phage holin family protein n=1 Tax=Vibrio porteresiae DSM 19223 TaxID=1123496 RepID=A0ABZ0Q919_9VIBR|nr:phage holin family protein [Vibrio porteresiae]WPC72939.1 phage holin family protein [Vibrio porteresiae DSM 19223]
MRMNEKVSSSLSYFWNTMIGVFGSVSTDAYMVIIALVGMLLTAFINNYWQKKTFKANFPENKS